MSDTDGTIDAGASYRRDLHARVEHDLTNHAPSSPLVAARLDAATELLLGVGHWIVEHVPPGREQSTALTKLEEVSMQVKAGIARHQDRVRP